MIIFLRLLSLARINYLCTKTIVKRHLLRAGEKLMYVYELGSFRKKSSRSEAEIRLLRDSRFKKTLLNSLLFRNDNGGCTN
jgi:hypothetical protein